jgi:glycerol-3-phosphate dehydrogenase subunit B
MKHDVVVVGAGLAGLSCALRLAEGGKKVLVAAKGMGAIQLAGGTIDVLGYAPHRIDQPKEALAELIGARPDHPYARLGEQRVAGACEWFKEAPLPYAYEGDLLRNFLLPTATGAVKPAALVPQTMAPGDLHAGGRFVITGFSALKDFYPAYAAANLSQAGGDVSARPVTLDIAPEGEADVTPLGFARHFDSPASRKEMVALLRPRIEAGESVGFPAVLGLAVAAQAWSEIQDALAAPVFEIPTLPPSVPGLRLLRTLRPALRARGVRILMGGEVTATGDGGRVPSVATQAANRRIVHELHDLVLATGGFASGGLVMDSHGNVRETVLGLPVRGVPDADEARFSPEVFGSHPLARAGIAVDAELRPIDEEGNIVYENVRVTGATLGGAEPWREKSGDGISLATGVAAADAILERST